jgi:hypothetical protein
VTNLVGDKEGDFDLAFNCFDNLDSGVSTLLGVLHLVVLKMVLGGDSEGDLDRDFNDLKEALDGAGDGDFDLDFDFKELEIVGATTCDGTFGSTFDFVVGFLADSGLSSGIFETSVNSDSLESVEDSNDLGI